MLVDLLDRVIYQAKIHGPGESLDVPKSVAERWARAGRAQLRATPGAPPPDGAAPGGSPPDGAPAPAPDAAPVTLPPPDSTPKPAPKGASRSR